MTKRFRVVRWSLGPLLLAGALACQRPHPDPPGEEPAGPPWFADVTGQAGLHFVHDAGPVGRYFLPQAMGSGAALFDFDNDGRLDIYLLQNGGPDSGSTNRLFHQLPDGTFQDVSAGSGLDVAGFNMGVAVGDVNNDGFPDVLVTRYGGIKLFLNNGNGTFTDVTKEAGLDNPAWGTSAAFFDYDRDGWLDLVVVNYLDYDPTWPCTTASGRPDYCAPRAFGGRVSRLFHNLGKTAGAQGVRFEDVTEASGLGRLAGPGLGVVCADFDGDGWPDLFIANDGQPNRLWINRHDGTFREEAVQRGVAFNALGQAEAGMGVALGDVDGDGLFDLFVTHLTEETNTLWRQGPRGLFHDRTAGAGLAVSRGRGTGFGTVLADFDQDGALDVAVVNGRVSRAGKREPGASGGLDSFWRDYAERNHLFADDGMGHFRDISAANPALCGTANVARGLAWGDLDGDGAPDLLVTTVAGPARLYRNVAPQRGHWLLVRSRDPALQRDAYGAEVRVRAGDRRWVRWINPGGSYLCSSDPRAHFGLGSVGHVEGIEVLWPDGTTETFPGCSADQKLVLLKGAGLPGREP
jgi:enediyne biosynthesis protein E4